VPDSVGDRMLCDNEFCIYNRKCACILPDIRRNRAGDCGECIFVVLDKNFLEAEKTRQLDEIERQWEADEKRRAHMCGDGETLAKRRVSW